MQNSFTFIFKIYINGLLVEKPMSSAREMYHVTRYTGPPCNVNPCINGGQCMPRLDDVECKCTKRYYGQQCEKGKFKLNTARFSYNIFKEILKFKFKFIRFLVSV